MENKLNLILVDPNKMLCDAFNHHFSKAPNVHIVNGIFEELSHFDCIVSAANSFGLMDGGIDLAIIQFFGVELMDQVQAYILSHYRGEQPVGTSFIIETKHPKFSYLAHTPTMRVPMSIQGTDYVYNAMWAMLLAVYQHNQTSSKKIYTIACPGLGTSFGQMPFDEAAYLMALAYQNFLNPPRVINWPYAQARQGIIRRGGSINVSRGKT